ncbi:MAG: transglutaminase-like domain-containing protein, partial [Planctomycetales bacterium]|nr:transglutaminase-like domain-containing protein [Planctomycetales bacterium]
GKALLITRQAMGQTQEQTVDWPDDALLSEGLRLFQLKRGLTPGDSFEVRLFRPDMLMALTAQARVGEKTKVDLFGRLLELTEVELTMQVGTQQIVMTSYVDEQMKALKTQVPMMNMVLEMIACDKSVALRDDDIVDFLDKLSIASPVKLMNLNTIEAITYTLKPAADKRLELPVSSYQQIENTPDRIQVTVKRTEPSGPVAFPYKGDNPEAMEALAPMDYLQSDDATVIDLAKRAVGDANDAVAAAIRIEAFVDGFITQKDLSVGYASATEVAQTRQGDCSEHAVLAAAMCRAVGIPARVVCGVVYADSFLSKQSIFGGHMWTEVWLGNAWFGLDATRSERQGFGPGHIALTHGNGDPIDFFGLVNTLGCFEIEKITIQKKPEAAETAPDPVITAN